MLNRQPPMPITGLRYFIGLIEEVSQTDEPDGYWQHLRLKADQLESSTNVSNGTVALSFDAADRMAVRWTT